MKNILYIVGGVLLFRWIYSAKQIAKFSYSIPKIKFDKQRTNINQIAINVDVEITNPSNIDITLQEIVLNVMYKDYKLAIITNTTAKIIPKYSSVVVTLPTTVKPLIGGAGLFTELYKKFITNTFNTIKLDIKGFIKTNYGSLPVDESKTII